MDRKRKGKSSRIVPSDESESLQGVSNPGFEMSDAYANNISVSSKFRDMAKEVHEKHNALHVIANVKQAASKWSNYVAKRRIRKQNTVINQDETERPKTGGIGLDDIHNEFVNTGSETLRSLGKSAKEQEMTIASNRALMQYFAKLGQSADDEVLNLDFIDTLLKSGADINCCDRYGQTILHEVARAWHTDVAKFLLEHGADVNKPDIFGRTPLHVAAATDYPQMVVLLIENDADKEACTFNENQTPVHYAAKNDAISSLKTLVKLKCEYKEVMDYKGRTPIHVAAELDRSETARLLLDLQAPVGVSDNKGQKAITWMITKMAPVASEALHQFRTTDRPNRKQYYYLNLLVQDRERDPHGHTQTPLQVAVNYRQYDLLMMQVFRKLINIMWHQFGRRGAWINLLINFVYIVLWTAIGILVEFDQRHVYVLPGQWWRIVLLLTAIGFTAWQIFEEVREYFRSRKAHRNWVNWRTKEIDEDMKFCHPRWPEEKNFLISEKDALDKLSPKYFNDWWNVFDWLCYFLLLVCIATHFADIGSHSVLLARWHIRIMCVTIIFLWLRLMKNARAFSLLGPFIVMLGKMTEDLIRFAFLYLEFYIPYACAFWMIFGGDKLGEDGELKVVGGFETAQDMMFSLFRLTLVDEYDYDGMKSVDSLMAGILVATWLALSAVMCLNLLIALLSDTFQRVYDNAQANAVMQKAITIISIWEGMSKKRRLKFLDYIRNECAPQADYYDDDLTQAEGDDLKKVTMQIKDQLDEIQEAWRSKFGGFATGAAMDEAGLSVSSNGSGIVTNEKFELEVHGLRKSVNELKSRQEEFSERFRKDMKAVKILLQHLLNQDGGPGFGGGTGGRFELGGLEELESHDSRTTVDTEGRHSRPSTSVRKMKKRKKSKSPYQGEELLEPIEDEARYEPRESPYAEITTVRFPDQSEPTAEEEV